MTAALAWDHAILDIPDTGLTAERVAAADELERVARALDLAACASLEARYAIAAPTNGRYRLAGSLQARIEQTCVVTLEPILSEIAEPFDCEFWPAQDIPAPVSGELDLRNDPEPEPIVAGQIEVGRIVFECLASAINPFPRLPDAKLDWQPASPAAAEGKSDSPFAVLAKIRDGSPEQGKR
jgi:hypothetical protein